MIAAAPERDYARAITDALSIERPQDSVARVKDVIIAKIQEADTHVRVLNTQYFNHTYSPDLVLTWPRDPSAERYVYLRFNDDLRYMYDGINHMHGHEPIVFALSPMPFDREDRFSYDFTANSSPYETLWAHPQPQVDLLITLGSPLAMPDVVFDKLHPAPEHRKGHRPPGVRRWINIADPGDIIAIPRHLDRFFEGIDADLTTPIASSTSTR